MKAEAEPERLTESEILSEPLEMWCFGDPEGRYPVFDAGSSIASPGRWNEMDAPMIYTSERFATAMLEKLAHCGHSVPPNVKAVRAVAPHGCSVEIVKPEVLPGWDSDKQLTRGFGSAWVREARSLLLIVPSVVAQRERNVLVNPAHKEFSRIEVGPEEAVTWDERLFG